MPEDGKDTWEVESRTGVFPFALSLGHIIFPVRRLAGHPLFEFVTVKEARMYFATL
jgi:hypothetical protein